MSIAQANRGTALEDLVLQAARGGVGSGIAITHSPARWKPRREGGKVVGAYPERTNTVDFTGVVMGLPVAFDAKEVTVLNRFDWDNLTEEQARFLEGYAAAGGFAFLLIAWWRHDLLTIAPVNDWLPLWRAARPRSIPFADATQRWRSLTAREAGDAGCGTLWREVYRLARSAQQ